MNGNDVVVPEIGDFAVVKMRGSIGKLIKLGQWLNGGFSEYQHAFVYVGDGLIVEADPGGARIVALSRYDRHDMLWSTGRFEMTGVQRTTIYKMAEGFAKPPAVPYSFLDYLAIAAHTLHLPGGSWLRRYVATSRHMICSQLVDACYDFAGVHLFQDDRWPGYVTPADLAHLIGGI